MQEELMSVEEAAALVKRSASSVWRWLRTGALEAVVVAGRTRFRREAVLRLLEPRTRKRAAERQRPAAGMEPRPGDGAARERHSQGTSSSKGR
jgi:excisionase family DNA binding protein